MKKKVETGKLKSTNARSQQVDQCIIQEATNDGARPEHVKQVQDFFESCLNEVLEEKHDFFLQEVAKKLKAYKALDNSAGIAAGQSKQWIKIESLSRLRSEVGGRFQNIKAKWLEAGLPLREHRGDRNEGSNLSEEGWLILSSWISSQGFEARLANDEAGTLFEIRKRE